KATVEFADGVSTDDLIATVERAGYTAELPAPPKAEEGEATPAPAAGRRCLRPRLHPAVARAVPAIAVATTPALPVRARQWLSLTLAAPVVVYAGWPFHRAAAINLRHGTATMDTLISLGTLAAFGWSLWALFFGSAGDLGIKHGFEFSMSRSDGSMNIYLE